MEKQIKQTPQRPRPRKQKTKFLQMGLSAHNAAMPSLEIRHSAANVGLNYKANNTHSEVKAAIM